ncbi:adenylate/guanylate cyclase domain-containing protein [Marinibaculum pumilum]|uniref:Adenylate/guanylate cyclase domain-containing protein n=1 Tax=Marinibaculum pumilum TaxID=1766165 RepID=A0ABV7L0B5_9PROT
MVDGDVVAQAGAGAVAAPGRNLPDGANADLDRAERNGMRLAQWGRTAAIGLFAVYGASFPPFPTNALFVGAAALFLLPGLWHLHSLYRGTERRWQRFFFLTLDVAALALVGALVPPDLGGEVPVIVNYQVIGIYYVFPFIAIAALALSPALVLWTAGIGVLGWVAGWAHAASQLENPLHWSDLPPTPSAAEYLAVVKSVNFAAAESRVTEVFFILVTAGILALAVKRARRVVRDRAALDRERANALAVFGQYVPSEIATRLMRDPTALAPQTREATVMFVDIAGFTHLSERLPPAELIALLNGYFERATAMVADAGGVVVGFAGDGFLAAFNAPRLLDQHAACALRAARDLQELVRNHRFGGERVRIRIGIATGPVAAGIVGGSSHQTFTVYGDTVNLAQRLESMCKAHDTYLLVAETSWSAAGRPPGLLEIGPVEVRGRDSRVRAYAAARQAAQQTAAQQAGSQPAPIPAAADGVSTGGSGL